MSLLTLLFLTCTNALNYFDRYLMAAVLPVVSAQFSLSNEQAGRLMSLFVLGYFLFSPFFGVLGDRLSRVRLMAFGVLLWSLATAASGVAETFLMLALARVLVGVGEASFGTIAPAYIKDRVSSPELINKAFSIFFCAMPVGSALGYVAGGLFVHYATWNDAFYWAGIVGIAAALVVWRLKPVPHPAVSESPTDIRTGLREIWRVPVLRFAIGGYILNSFALTGIAAFISQLGVSIGFSPSEMPVAFGIILVITGFGGSLLGGQLSARRCRRGPSPERAVFGLIALVSAIAVVPLALCFLTGDKVYFLALCFIVELLIFAAIPPVNALIVLATPPGRLALTQGVTIFLLNGLGALPAPVLIGLLADRLSGNGLAYAMQITTVALALSAVVWAVGYLYARRSR